MNERYTFAFFPLKRPSIIPGAPLEWVPQVTQGLRNKFQMTGANYYLMTQILSKTVQFSFFSESYEKIDGCKWGFLKIDGCNCNHCTYIKGAPVTSAMNENLQIVNGMR